MNTDIAVGFPGFFTEEKRSVEEKRQNTQRYECQLPIHRKHKIENTGDGEHIAEHHDNAGGKHFVEYFYIVCQARDESADWIVVVKLQ